MAEIKVMASAAFKQAYLELLPRFERSSGHTALNLWVPSVQMMSRLKDGEPVDVVILAATALDELIRAGIVTGRTDLARSGIGVAVKAGAPRPDISSAEAVKRTVLAAKSIVCSTGPSGIHLRGLFERMGIADEIRHKVKQSQGVPAGSFVASGEAEIAFQQMSELLPVPGIDIIGPLPPDVQQTTIFSAGIHTKAQQPDAARALLRFLAAPEAIPVIRSKGLEPA
ncbi:MAG: substrate-binding domain-containing protein [Burkholderiales bacterium]